MGTLRPKRITIQVGFRVSALAYFQGRSLLLYTGTGSLREEKRTESSATHPVFQAFRASGL